MNRCPPGFDAVFVQRQILARYALAIVAWNDGASASVQLRRARRELANLLWAFPIVREVGLYLIFHGPSEQWARHVDDAPADRTGLHRVIVQAVHFIDLESRVHKLNQSRWSLSELTHGEVDLEIRFGGVDKVAPVIIDTLRSQTL